MIEQKTIEWFQQRKNRLTASSVGAVLGEDPWRTRQDVMRQMVRDSYGAENEWKSNPALAWGTANESNARLEFELESGLVCDPAPFIPHEDWLGASPDAIIGFNAIAEFKCPYGLRSEKNPVFKMLSSQPQYYSQIQTQLLCAGIEKCHFYQWTPYGSSWEVVHVDHAWRDENLPKLRQFYAEFLDELANNADEHLAPRRVTLDSPEAHRMVREWDDLCEQEDWVEKRKKELLAEIIAAAGEKNAEFAGRKLTKVEREGSVSWAKLAKEHCPNVDTAAYRGKSSTYWKLT